MKRISMVLGILVCLTVVMACVTVNIYFPAAEIQQAADEIVDDVRPEQQEEKDGSLEGIRPNWLARLAAYFEPGSAMAQVNIDISSPTIRTLKNSLAGRFGSLKGFYNAGVLGENKTGYLEIRDESGLDLKNKANLRKLVTAENSDRKALYLEILKANNLETRFLPEVEKLFANSWRNKAIAGSWIQKDDGSWIKR
jgi:uncharacterized protein YdbL (DUF1318 family)